MVGITNIKVIIFSIDGYKYAIDIGYVERILSYTQCTCIPDVFYFIEGVITYEDEILPLINLSKKFNLAQSESNKDKKIIVVNRDENKFGIIVDDVYEISNISSDLFEEVPKMLLDLSIQYIDGFLKLEEDLVILINIFNLISKDEENSMFDYINNEIMVKDIL